MSDAVVKLAPRFVFEVTHTSALVSAQEGVKADCWCN